MLVNVGDGVGGGVMVNVTVDVLVCVCDGASCVSDRVQDRDWERMMVAERVNVGDGVGGGVMVSVTVDELVVVIEYVRMVCEVVLVAVMDSSSLCVSVKLADAVT